MDEVSFAVEPHVRHDSYWDVETTHALRKVGFISTLDLTPLRCAQLAVKKWQAIVDFYESNRGAKIDDYGTDTCMCCRKYFMSASCKGCPVAKHTDAPYCSRTAYRAHAEAKTWRGRKSQAEKMLAQMKMVLEKESHERAE